jgi:5'-3' exonuclease
MVQVRLDVLDSTRRDGRSFSRFRAAKDRKEAEAEATKKGIIIDADSVFDSNCITPGTDFMAVVSPEFTSILSSSRLPAPPI